MNISRRLFLPALAALITTVAISRPSAAQRLFRTDSTLTVTITTNLKAFIGERDSLKLQKFAGLLSYGDSGTGVTQMPVTLRARGHFRRLARNCAFPPVMLDFKSSDAKRTLMSGLRRLKITTNCRPGNGEYEQYILQEYALYRAYAALTDVSLKTRLARITYRDTLGKVAPITTWAFFTEDIEDLAARGHYKVMKAEGALFADLDQEPLALLSVFEYFIGNTDWSISAQHNIGLLADSTVVKINPVAFDFDWTGAVDARYSFPDSRLPIKRVTDRLYRGVCPTPALFTSTIELFRSRRATIDGILGKVPGLAPDRAKRMQGFYDDFWKQTNDPKSLQREFARDCQKQGN
jgi:hypothetical protein